MEAQIHHGPLALRSAGVAIIAVHALFLVLTTTALALRAWSKRLNAAPYHLEDYLVIVALMVFYGYTACSITGEQAFTAFSYANVRFKTSLANEFTYAVGIGLVKVSVCLLLARIFSVRRFKQLAWVVMGCCIAWAIMTILIGFLICTPLAFNWDHTILHGHCGNQNVGYAFVGIIDILTDLCIILLPQHMIWKLHLPKANKIALGLLFALGSLTIVLSVLRVIVLLNVDFSDFSFTIKNTEIWTIAEFGTSIIVSCGPVVRPAFEKIFPSTATRLKYGRGSKTRGKLSDNSNNRHISSNAGFTVLDDSEIPLKPLSSLAGTGLHSAAQVTTSVIAGSSEATPKCDFPLHQNTTTMDDHRFDRGGIM
ncbi:Satratoxin biosynthesis SC1 cluster protein 4, partial [Lachnellula arida]